MYVAIALLSLNILSSVLCNPIKIELLRDFCENHPLQVNVYLCQGRGNRKFSREIYKIHNYISVQIVNNANVSLLPSLLSEEMNYIVDLDCSDGMEVLKMANEKKLFESPNRWLLLTKKEYTLEKFSQLDFLIDSSVYIAQRVMGNAEVAMEIAEIYKINVKEPTILNKLGYWKSNYSVFNSNYPSALKRKDLGGLGIPAVIVVTENETMNVLHALRDKHLDTVSKYNYILTNQALDFMNSRYTWARLYRLFQLLWSVLSYGRNGKPRARTPLRGASDSDGQNLDCGKYMVEDSWGYKINGTYNGMVGKLQAGEAEIGATALFLTEERRRIVDYVSMTTTTRFRFIFRQPKLSSVKNIFLLPFNQAVWVSCYGITFIVAFMLYISVKYENTFAMNVDKKREKRARGSRNHLRLTWGDALFVTFGASCQQGFFADARGVAGRLVTIALYIEVILLYTSYSANIVALIQSSGLVIRSVSDLLHSPMRIGVHDVVYNRYFFAQKFQDPEKNELYRKKIAPAGKKAAYYTMEEGIERVRKGLFAFHVELGSGYKLIQETFATDEKCDLYEIPFLPVSNAWIAIKKHSPYRKIIKVAFRRIQECGLQQREFLRWFTKRPTCEGRQSNFVQVGLVDIRLALFALGAGILIALMILAFELFIFPKLKSGNNKVISKRL